MKNKSILCLLTHTRIQIAKASFRTMVSKTNPAFRIGQQHFFAYFIFTKFQTHAIVKLSET